MYKNRGKGLNQIDFAIAVFIIVTTAAFSVSYVTNYQSRGVTQEKSAELRTTIDNLQRILFESEGIPKNWDVPAHWWNSYWLYRQKINVTNNNYTQTLEQNYTINVTFNHSQLVEQGKSIINGSDVRIIWYNSTSGNNIELDRLNTTPFNNNTNNTVLWFKLQQNVSANQSDTNYFLYYGNPSAGAAPVNGSNVYLNFTDDFNDGVIGPLWKNDIDGIYPTETGGYWEWSSSNTGLGVFDKGVRLNMVAAQDYSIVRITVTSGGTAAYANWVVMETGFIPQGKTLSTDFVVCGYWRDANYPGKMVRLLWKINGGATNNLDKNVDDFPEYVRLIKNGTTYYCEHGNDGITWSSANNVVIDNANFTNLHPIVVYGFGGNTPNPSWVRGDDFYATNVRKYLSPEPLAALGSEEKFSMPTRVGLKASVHRTSLMLNESGGVNRTNESLDVRVTFDSNCANKAHLDTLTLTDRFMNEVPLNIYNSTVCSTGFVKEANINFRTNQTANTSSIFWLYFSNKSSIDETGLAGFWKFDESSGETAYDLSGSRNNGTLRNGPKRVYGNFGNALQFDGTDDYINLSTLSKNYGTERTWEFWIKPARAHNSASAEMVLMGDYNNYNGIYVALADSDCGGFGSVSAGSLCVGYGKGSVLQYDLYNSVKTSWNANQWHHIAIATDSATQQLYIDGVLDKTHISYGTPASGSQNFFMIGKDPVWSYPYFNGTIDEVRIYNRSLSGVEVKALYDLNAPKYSAAASDFYEPSLVGYWKLESANSTNSTFDESQYQNHGKLINYTCNPATCNFTSGKIGNALQFDGVNDYVDLGDVPDRSTETYCAWVNKTDHTFIRTIVARVIAGDGSTPVQFYIGTDGKVTILLNAGAQVTSGTTILQNNIWYHVCGGYNSTMSFISVNEIVENYAGTSSIPASIGMRIGGRITEPQWFKGLIDEVRIYNRSLSADEIRQLYYYTLPKHVSGGAVPVVSYFKINALQSLPYENITASLDLKKHFNVTVCGHSFGRALPERASIAAAQYPVLFLNYTGEIKTCMASISVW